jgi:hypothetical protein
VPLATNPEVHFELCPDGAGGGGGSSSGGGGSSSGGGSGGGMAAAVSRGPAAAAAGAPPARAACVRVEAPEGLVFELNNRVPHRVSNLGASERVHLVIDVSEAPRPRRVLAPGAVCRYGPAQMVCEEPAAARAAKGEAKVEAEAEARARPARA